MRKVVDYDETEELDFDTGLAEEADEAREPVVPEYTWGVRAVETATEQNLIEYSSRPGPDTGLKTWVCSGPLRPYSREDVPVRLTSSRRFGSVAEARRYHKDKFGVVYEDQSRPDLGYYSFVLPVLG